MGRTVKYMSLDEQYEEDLLVLAEMERDLSASYVAERVTPGHSLHGQKLYGPSTALDINQDFNMIDEDEEKQIELMDVFDNKPLKRSTSRKRKRSNEIGDEFEDYPNPKRAKTSTLELMVDDTEDVQGNDDENTLYLHGRPSLNDNTSMMITNDDGERLYIYYDSLCQYDRDLKQCLKAFKSNVRCLNSLGILQEHKTIDELLDEVQAERISLEVREMNTMSNGNEKEEQPEDIATELWTDKYAPSTIHDLLSSEMINREVTAWVKQWDYIVFGHQYKRKQHRN